MKGINISIKGINISMIRQQDHLDEWDQHLNEGDQHLKEGDQHIDDRQLDHLDERDQLAANQPDVNHLDVGGRGQLVHEVGEDGCHHQHGSQVHGDSPVGYIMIL